MGKQTAEKTLEDLKANYGRLENKKNTYSLFLPYIKSFLSDGQNAALDAVRWLNDLSAEYNRDYAVASRDEEKNFCLFHAFRYLLPLLSGKQKMISMVNMCILMDDDSINEGAKLFLDALEQANRFARQMLDNKKFRMDITVCGALTSLGYLNFREHKYEDARPLLESCRNWLCKFGEKSDNPDIYTKCLVYLANCHEYTNQAWLAVQVLLGSDAEDKDGDEDKFKKRVLSNLDQVRKEITDLYCDREKFSSLSFAISKIKKVCQLICSPDRVGDLQLILAYSNRGGRVNEWVKLYIHMLAHILSEYAAKERENYNEFCSVLQLFSRFLLDWLVYACDEKLVTCQANIRAENDSCPDAIKLLLTHYDKLTERDESAENMAEKFEIEFYIFYFAEQELRFDYKDERLESIFDTYGDLFRDHAEKLAKDENDFDALFHYYVILFRYRLKKCMEDAIRSSGEAEIDKASENSEILKLNEVFTKMCEFKDSCSKHVLDGLKSECDRLEYLYALFQQFRWLKADKRAEALANFNSLLVYSENMPTRGKHESQNRWANDIIGHIYKMTTKRNSIMILAPIKSAPSCASSSRGVDKLVPIPDEIEDGEDFPQNYAPAFETLLDNRNNAALEALPNFIGALRGKMPKWAVYYRGGNKLYFFDPSRDVREEYVYSSVYPAILNEGEKRYLDRTLATFREVLHEQPTVRDEIKCSSHRKLYAADGNRCYTYQLNFNGGRLGEIKENIDRLLTFFEHNYMDSNGMPTWNDSDNIIVQCILKDGKETFEIMNIGHERFVQGDEPACRIFEFPKKTGAYSVPEEDAPRTPLKTCKAKITREQFAKAIIQIEQNIMLNKNGKQDGSEDHPAEESVNRLETILEKVKTCGGGICVEADNEVCSIAAECLEREII